MSLRSTSVSLAQAGKAANKIANAAISVRTIMAEPPACPSFHARHSTSGGGLRLVDEVDGALDDSGSSKLRGGALFRLFAAVAGGAIDSDRIDGAALAPARFGENGRDVGN